jgi:hypothetical protein
MECRVLIGPEEDGGFVVEAIRPQAALAVDELRALL